MSMHDCAPFAGPLVMHHGHAKLVAACLMSISSTLAVAGASKMTWPSLATFKAVTGRAATKADVSNGAAVFVIQHAGKPIGKPINIALPQYAYHVDEESGRKQQCVVIQAEEAQGQRLIGAYLLADHEYFAGFYSEFQLLGTKPPPDAVK